MAEGQRHGLRFIHRALSDPMRLRVLESLWRAHPQSAKELAEWVSVQPDRLYYHLSQLERAGLIEIAEYRPLPGGKVERMHRPTTIEPPEDAATPLEISQFLNTVLEATQIDITTASLAKERGERREITLLRSMVRLSDEERFVLREQIHQLVQAAQEKTADTDIWTRVVVTFIDLEDRNQGASMSNDADAQS
jgi:DNA-binding transcriptional ArsR family regulator